MGDLNAKHISWGCRVSNSAGSILSNIINQLHLKIHSPTEPTYYPFNNNIIPDILDIAISNFPLSLTSYVFHELDSDHNPVLLTSQVFCPPPSPPPTLSVSSINWATYQSKLENMLPPIKILQSAHEIDNAVSLITNSITTAVLESTPKRPLLTQNFQNLLYPSTYKT